MELQILDGVAEELAAFDEKENRPYWPNVPTACPVKTCTGPEYASFSSFQRHWQLVHIRHILLFKCPNCGKTFNRADNAKKHQTKIHSMESTLEKTSVINSKFVDPEGVESFRMDHRERLAAKRKATAIVGDSLVNEGDVCRDESVTFDEAGHTTGKVFKRN